MKIETDRWWQKLKRENPDKDMGIILIDTASHLKKLHWKRDDDVDDLVEKGVSKRVAKDITYDRMTRNLTDGELSYLKEERDLKERKVSRDYNWTEF